MTLPPSIPLNDYTRAILGRPCFACIQLAQFLRETGHVVARKAEDEQAAVMHWCLNLYLEHGEAWMEKGNEMIAEHNRAIHIAEEGL